MLLRQAGSRRPMLLRQAGRQAGWVQRGCATRDTPDRQWAYVRDNWTRTQVQGLVPRVSG